ncbi:MAG: SLATT domain-containing protein [Methylobacter sp.]|nr:SLATT domain-containing protein [Methylobacter sp.]
MKIEQKQLLKSWRDELRIMMRTHYVLSTKIRLLNYVLGIPCIIIAMLIASYIFFTINQDVVLWVKMLFGLLTLLLAILASLQTFLKYSEQAENHRNASARYQALFNGIDQLLAIPPKDEAALGEWCDKLRERWDELNLEAPNIANKFKQESEAETVSSSSAHEDNYQVSAE